MNKRLISMIVLGLVVIAAVVAVGVYEYRAGMARGLVAAAQAPVGPYPYWAVPYFHPFGFVFPLLVVLLVFAIAGRIFWWARFGGPGYWHRGLPDLDEWHRKAHESIAREQGR